MRHFGESTLSPPLSPGSHGNFDVPECRLSSKGTSTCTQQGTAYTLSEARQTSSAMDSLSNSSAAIEAELALVKEQLARALQAKVHAEEQLEEVRRKLPVDSKERTYSRYHFGKTGVGSSIDPARPTGWKQWFCPNRSRDVELQGACIQDTCWQLLLSTPLVIAVLCSADDFTITDASKKACKIWGSSALYGKPLFSLLEGSHTAPWLMQALNHDALLNNMNNIALKDIGCERFKGADAVIEMTIWAASLPPEPRLARPMVHMILMDPLETNEKKYNGKEPKLKRSEPTKDKLAKKSSNSKLCSNQITPPDENPCQKVLQSLSDVVIQINSELEVGEAHAEDLARQEECFGWVLSGQNFGKELYDSDAQRLTDILLQASASNGPSSMRAKIRRPLGDCVANLVVLCVGAVGFRFAVGIRLESHALIAPTSSGDFQNLDDLQHLKQTLGGVVAGNGPSSACGAPSPSVTTGHTSLQRDDGFAGGSWRVLPNIGLGVGEFTTVKTVATGSQGVVFHVKDRAGQDFALKKVYLPAGYVARRRFGPHLKNADRETRVLKSLAWASAVIVRIHDCWIQDDFQCACIVMDYVPKTLSDVIEEEEGRPVPLHDACRWLTHIATGLAIIHDAGFMHRDIKPSNILLTADHRWCKIADLGIGRALNGAPALGDDVSQCGTNVEVQTILSGYTAHMGTKAYMSPEAENGGNYNTITDVYSLGCVLFELLTCLSHEMVVQEASAPQEEAQKVLANFGTSYSQELVKLFESVSMLCLQMLHPSPDARPSARSIIGEVILQDHVHDLLAHHKDERLHDFFARTD